MANFLSSEPDRRRRKLVRTLRVTAPLLFLCLTLLVANWPFAQPPAAPIPVAATAVSPAIFPALSATPTAVPPTLTPTPTPTPLPTATLPPEAQIRLFGPPDAALFRAGDTLTVYWQWPYPLDEGRFFRIVFRSAEGEVTLGEALEPNLGEMFFLQVPVSLLGQTGDSGQWQVQLLAASGQLLLSSEPRALRLLRP